jgi:hypothetical protein
MSKNRAMMMIRSRHARSIVDDFSQAEVHDLNGCGGAGRVDNHNVLRLQVSSPIRSLTRSAASACIPDSAPRLDRNVPEEKLDLVEFA